MSNELLGWKIFLGKTKTQIHKIDKFDHDQSWYLCDKRHYMVTDLEKSFCNVNKQIKVNRTDTIKCRIWIVLREMKVSKQWREAQPYMRLGKWKLKQLDFFSGARGLSGKIKKMSKDREKGIQFIVGKKNWFDLFQ